MLNTSNPTYTSYTGTKSLLDLTLCSTSIYHQIDCFVSDSTFESDHNPVDTTRSLLRQTSKTIKTIDWNSIMKNSSKILSSSNSDLHTVMSKVSEMIKQDTKHTALPGVCLRLSSYACLSTSSVRGSRASPSFGTGRIGVASWLASASVVSRFMAVNNSQVKGGRRGQTVSVHPFTRALPRDLPKNAPSKWSDWSEFHRPQVRTSSDSRFAKPHAVGTRLMVSNRVPTACLSSNFVRVSLYNPSWEQKESLLLGGLWDDS
ncbi:hypothetical protein AVEN_145806-1 [Araneus ventricosus]|uniref:Endonuclease/exonuclease/phosphatase domain-containing protein n=1 Tax=Araneus ventricosus TaxID=182803 RepID=A0A4Y2QFK2_ARAVE|nr:hypothetical protein AVEN_187419-1 [Araneus ventricosus]GBN61196.1 hypothetical protein AVEN_145806-1 [Araneus ventricosus]